jgi:hypothetical protein
LCILAEVDLSAGEVAGTGEKLGVLVVVEQPQLNQPLYLINNL